MQYLIHRYFCWKNVSSFCKCKSYTHFFSKNISVYAIFNDQSFNDTLTNIVSFWTTGPRVLMQYHNLERSPGLLSMKKSVVLQKVISVANTCKNEFHSPLPSSPAPQWEEHIVFGGNHVRSCIGRQFTWKYQSIQKALFSQLEKIILNK